MDESIELGRQYYTECKFFCQYNFWGKFAYRAFGWCSESCIFVLLPDQSDDIENLGRFEYDDHKKAHPLPASHGYRPICIPPLKRLGQGQWKPFHPGKWHPPVFTWLLDVWKRYPLDKILWGHVRVQRRPFLLRRECRRDDHRLR